MAELHDLTALEQAAAIRSREVSAVDLTEHYLQRAEELNDRVGAFITVTPETAIDQARSVDELIASSPRDVDVSPLAGVVCPTKDLNQVAGVRCTFGSKALQITASADDNVVARLRDEGLVFTGTTNTPEFGLPCYTENDIAPPARTPWDLNRSAGGSSGGAAAAVAAGLAPLAQGSDGGGSIRIPASVCGLVGLKPSRGRVSNGPLPDGIGELAVQGPIARTVRDAAALLDAMAGGYPDDPFVAAPPGESFLAAANHEPGTLRIGCYRTPVIADTTVHPDCIDAYERTLALLAELGHVVEQMTPPFGHQAVESFEVLWAVGAASIPIPPDEEDNLLPLTRWLRERGRALTATDVTRALAVTRSLARTSIIASAGYDVVVTPTLAQPPAPVGSIRNDADPTADFEAQKAFTPFTAAYNITGQPAMTLPLHRTVSGLPIGTQFIGRPRDERTLITLGAQLEQARPWLGWTPDLW
jgi:amidase